MWKKLIIPFLIVLFLVLFYYSLNDLRLIFNDKIIFNIFQNASYVLNSKSPKKVAGLFFVKRVVDGDTIELENGQIVRYIGINTAETKDPRKSVECFGREAYEENKKLVAGKNVRLVKDVSETDKYGRLLRYVYLDDIFVNDHLVKNGFAQVSTYPPDVKYKNMFLESQRQAKIANAGLWKSCP